jgi:hypothetical protein
MAGGVILKKGTHRADQMAFHLPNFLLVKVQVYHRFEYTENSLAPGLLV